MASLLSLPREIRDLILQFALITSRPAPRLPWEEPIGGRGIDGEPQENRHTLRICGEGYWSPAYYTKHERHVLSSMPAFLALLLSNKQLADEARDTMRRFGRPDFNLDIMFVNEVEIWPTWVWAVPMLDGHAVRRLNVSIRYRDGQGRSLGPRATNAHYRYTWMWSRNICSRSWEMVFTSLLKRFLYCGPAGGCIKEKDKQWSIGELNIDVLDIPSMHDLDLAHDLGIARDDRDTPWLAKPLVEALQELLRSNNNVVNLSELLYTRVGRLTISAGGTVISDWELGKELKTLGQGQPITFPRRIRRWQRSYSDNDRIKEAIRMKKAAQERRTRGLPMA